MNGSRIRLAIGSTNKGSRSKKVAAGAGVLVALALPAVVLAAAPVERFRDHFSDTFANQLCGIDGSSTIVVQNTFTLYSDDSFKSVGSYRETFTAENGKAVTITATGTTSGPAPIIDEDAGTITFVTTFKGLPEKIQTLRGKVLLRDAGIITFADTFDLETGEFLGTDVTVKGPHPEADSDFEAFCEVIVPALT